MKGVAMIQEGYLTPCKQHQYRLKVYQITTKMYVDPRILILVGFLVRNKLFRCGLQGIEDSCHSLKLWPPFVTYIADM